MLYCGKLIILISSICLVSSRVDPQETFNITLNRSNDINMIFVLHSHLDPGWLETFENYYKGSIWGNVSELFEQTFTSLFENNNKKYTLAEMSFFDLYLTNATADQINLIRIFLVLQKYEFLNGGWVMNDEACTYYEDIIEQYTIGHLLLQDKFNIRPRYAWQIDPFGHSRGMARLIAEIGFESWFIERIGSEVQEEKRNEEKMEVLWRPYKEDNSTAILTIYNRYKYNDYPFNISQCNYRMELCGSRLSAEFIENLMDRFFLDYKNHPELTVANKILMHPLGDDFTIPNISEWSLLDQALNYAYEIGFYKHQVSLTIGTTEDYMNNLFEYRWNKEYFEYKEEGREDYFPYDYLPKKQYWTGYYSSKSIMKRFVRFFTFELLNLRKLLNLWILLNESNYLQQHKEEILRAFENVNKEQALMQHHDAVTGTAKLFVIKDYETRMLTAWFNLNNHIHQILKEQSESQYKFYISCFYEPVNNCTKSYFDSSHASGINNTDEILFQTLINTYVARNFYVMFNDVDHPENGMYELVDEEGEILKFDYFCLRGKCQYFIQIFLQRNEKKNIYFRFNENIAAFPNHVDKIDVSQISNIKDCSIIDSTNSNTERMLPIKLQNDNLGNNNTQENITFKLKTDFNLNYTSGYIQATKNSGNKTKIIDSFFYPQPNQLQNNETDPKQANIVNNGLYEKQFNYRYAQEASAGCMFFQFKNNHSLHFFKNNMTFASFEYSEKNSSCTSKLWAIQYGYYSDSSNPHSGCYIFSTHDNDIIPLEINSTEINIQDGEDFLIFNFAFPKFFDSKIIFNKNISTDFRVITTARLESEGESDFEKKEFVLRVLSLDEFNNNGEFYTDGNSLDVLKRVRKNDLKPHANYYPVNSFILIKSQNQSVAIINDRPQGGSSITEGSVELMLVRISPYDDAFGLGEACREMWPIDNQNVLINFDIEHRVLLLNTENPFSQITQAIQERDHPALRFHGVKRDSEDAKYTKHSSSLASYEPCELPSNIKYSLKYLNESTFGLRIHNVDLSESKKVRLIYDNIHVFLSQIIGKGYIVKINKALRMGHSLVYTYKEVKEANSKWTPEPKEYDKSTTMSPNVIELKPNEIASFVIEIQEILNMNLVENDLESADMRCFIGLHESEDDFQKLNFKALNLKNYSSSEESLIEKYVCHKDYRDCMLEPDYINFWGSMPEGEKEELNENSLEDQQEDEKESSEKDFQNQKDSANEIENDNRFKLSPSDYSNIITIFMETLDLINTSIDVLSPVEKYNLIISLTVCLLVGGIICLFYRIMINNFI